MNTTLFNQLFSVFRFTTATFQGMPEKELSDLDVTVLGRISSPSYRERVEFANRGLPLTSIIYCYPYDFDEKKDVLVKNGIAYKISELLPQRDGNGDLVFLKIFAEEIKADYES